jgi:prophage antirepressor-like protein
MNLNFTYFSPIGEPFPIRVAPARNPETNLDEPVFFLAQIAQAIGYGEKSAASLKPACRDQFVTSAINGSGRPTKAIFRGGLFFATPKSDTEDADHFHDWVRAVVFPALDLPQPATPADIGRFDAVWIESEQKRLEARYEKERATLQERLQAAETLAGICRQTEPAATAPAAPPTPSAKELTLQRLAPMCPSPYDFTGAYSLEAIDKVMPRPPLQSGETEEDRKQRALDAQAELDSLNARDVMKAFGPPKASDAA